MSQPLLIYSPLICSGDRLTGSNVYCYFMTGEQSIGHVQVKKKRRLERVQLAYGVKHS